MVVAIGSFFWRLYPLIRKMDADDQVEPKNYSAVLGRMILVFIASFCAAIVITLVSAG